MKTPKNQKILHLNDWMSTEYSVMHSHLVSIGDNVHHDHDFYEIVYLLNDSIRHTLNGQPFDLVAGDMIFLRPKDKHYFYRDDTNKNVVHRDIIFRKDFFEQVCDFLDKDFIILYEKSEMPVKAHLSFEELAVYEKTIKEYYLLNNQKSKNIFAKFLLIKLLNVYANQKTELNIYNESYPLWLNQLIQKMNMKEYFQQGLPVIRSFFTYDESYICHTFKKYMKMTMTEYINELRLNYAANQIILTSNTIINISAESGFNSISYFNKAFKKKYGVSPSVFRKRTKTQNSRS